MFGSQDLVKDVLQTCDESMAFLLGEPTSVGTLRDIAKQVNENGPEFMPGMCCLDTPSNSEWFGYYVSLLHLLSPSSAILERFSHHSPARLFNFNSIVQEAATLVFPCELTCLLAPSSALFGTLHSSFPCSFVVKGSAKTLALGILESVWMLALGWSMLSLTLCEIKRSNRADKVPCSLLDTFSFMCVFFSISLSADGHWFRGPCLTLQKCINDRPTANETGYSQAFENFAVTIVITDPTDDRSVNVFFKLVCDRAVIDFS